MGFEATGTRHHDDIALGSAVDLGDFAVFCSGLLNVFRNRGGADEQNGFRLWIREKRVAGEPAMHDVEQIIIVSNFRATWLQSDTIMGHLVGVVSAQVSGSVLMASESTLRADFFGDLRRAAWECCRRI